MTNSVRRLIGALLGAAALVMHSAGARAEVKSLTLGIDTTCSMGLSECWWLTLEGLITLEGVESIKDPPDNKAGTGEIKTKGGRLPDLAALAQHLSGIRNGSTLRGVEAVAEGRIEGQGNARLFRLSGTGETLELAPLTQRIDLDPRTSKLANATRSERNAFKDLLRKPIDSQQLVRITGPLRNVPGQKYPTLEVRLVNTSPVVEPPGGFISEVQSVTLGVDIKPYGLSECWSEFREEMNHFPGIASISKEPCLKTETLEISMKGSVLPDLKSISEFVQKVGVGATVRGVEGTIDGWMLKRDGKAVMLVPGCEKALRLGQLTEKIQFDLRKDRIHSISSVERRAFKDLTARWDGEPRRVRIVGPIVIADGQEARFEVRQYEILRPQSVNRNQLTTR